jgi:hypothetical protein
MDAVSVGIECGISKWKYRQECVDEKLQKKREKIDTFQ